MVLLHTRSLGLQLEMSGSLPSHHKSVAVHTVTGVEAASYLISEGSVRMLELEVQLPRERKIIEWDKASPTFCEVKERLGNCGIAKNWCVEILRGGEYVSPDDDTQLRDCKKLTVRAAPISEKIMLGPGTSAATGPGKPEILIQQREKPDLAEMIENVICFIGRLYICDEKCSDSSAITMKNCRGTVGLVGSSGETIGCWHTIEGAANKRALQRMFIEYPNYPKPLLFEAQIKDNLVSSDLDLFVAEPCEPLGEETAHLSSALDVSLADNVHCFGFPEIFDQELVEGYSRKKREQGQRCSKNELQRKLKLPTVFSGRVCFNGWKQAVADYLCFPNSSGGIVVDDYGCLKGVHVAAFRVGKTLDYHNMRIVKGTHKQTRSSQCGNVNLQSSLTKLHTKLNAFCVETAQCLNSCKSEVAAFVPVHIIEEPLQLSRLHLIRWKQPHGKKRDAAACEHSGRPCLIRPARNQLGHDDDDDDGTKFTSSRKKLRSQQPPNRNPLIWF